MDQICSILCDNWETERYTDPVPFQNSFGMAKLCYYIWVAKLCLALGGKTVLQ